MMTQTQLQNLTRRSLLSRSVYGIGAAALASLLNRPTAALASPGGYLTAPLTTKSTSWLSQAEQRKRRAHSGTGSAAPYRAT